MTKQCAQFLCVLFHFQFHKDDAVWVSKCFEFHLHTTSARLILGLNKGLTFFCVLKLYRVF